MYVRKVVILSISNYSYRLMNLYAGIHERSHLRYDVYCSLVRVAGQTDNVNALFKDITKVQFFIYLIKF